MERDSSSVTLDMETGPVYPPTTVTLIREKSTCAHSWRLGGALLAMALCVAAAIFFTLYAKNQDHIEEATEIQHTLRQLSGNGKAAIHLEGEYNTDGKYKTSVEWSDEVNPGFRQGGLRLEDNEIVIPRHGLYFVYSQASFRVSCKTKAHAEPELVHISHMVKRQTAAIGPEGHSEYRPLLHSLRTVCKSSDESDRKWYSAVYMGAVFSLEEGDRLQTVTENRLLPQLERGTGKNIFGVFAL